MPTPSLVAINGQHILSHTHMQDNCGNKAFFPCRGLNLIRRSVMSEIMREWTAGIGNLPQRCQHIFQGTLHQRSNDNIHLKLMWLASVWVTRDRLFRSEIRPVDPNRNPTTIQYSSSRDGEEELDMNPKGKTSLDIASKLFLPCRYRLRNQRQL